MGWLIYLIAVAAIDTVVGASFLGWVMDGDVMLPPRPAAERLDASSAVLITLFMLINAVAAWRAVRSERKAREYRAYMHAAGD